MQNGLLYLYWHPTSPFLTLWVFKIPRAAFLNYIKFVDLRIFRISLICEMARRVFAVHSTHRNFRTLKLVDFEWHRIPGAAGLWASRFVKMFGGEVIAEKY